MVRYTKILLALAVALWGLLGTLGNFAHYHEGMESVKAVMSMDTLPETAVPEGPKEPGALMVMLGYTFIWGLKLLGGALCLVGAVRMWATRNRDAVAFAHAKRWAIAGCGILLFMLFFGFSLVAAGLFLLHLSPLILSVQLAALFAAQIGIVMIFLHQQEA